jgi:hypothetical protein
MARARKTQGAAPLDAAPSRLGFFRSGLGRRPYGRDPSSPRRQALARKRRGVSSRKRAKPEAGSVGPNAINHRANAVRALRRQMLLEAERAKGGVRINGKDLFRRSIGKKRDCDRDQTAHEVGIAVAAIAQGRSTVAVRRRFAFQPHLTDAAPDLVGVVVGGRV